MADATYTVREAAELLGVKPGWIRKRIASGVISPQRVGPKRKGRYVLTARDIQWLEQLALQGSKAASRARNQLALKRRDLLERIEQLESDRANLLAQVAWARAVSKEQQKALEHERSRVERLEAELAAERARIEALKALSAWDRLRGLHKRI